MVNHACDLDGDLNSSKFSEPMPWIGIYVFLASLSCTLAMSADLIHGLKQRKFWFPTKYFTINATTLTLISVSIKLSVDLNTAMPRRQDQMSKLSSSVFICTVMGNSMPSLGNMETKELMMNITALVILVITLIANISIQLVTGVIYLHWGEHVVVMLLMLILLMILSFSALTVPTTKRYLEHKYNYKYQLAVQECSDEMDVKIKKLKGDLMKFWVMAHTSCPQFVIGRSVTCNAAGAFCLIAAMILAEAMIRTYLMPWTFEFCGGDSDYKWSVTLVLIVQNVAVGIGTIAPAFRWLMAMNFKCPAKPTGKSYREEFRLEGYWIQTLVEMKGCALALRIKSRRFRKFVHDAKNVFLNLCIRIQIGIVFASKVIRLISINLVSLVFACFRGFSRLSKFDPDISVANHDLGSESRSNSKLDLSRFVLHLQGEDEIVHFIMKKNCDATDHFMVRGERKQPKHLIKLVEISKLSDGFSFKGVLEFDSHKIPPLDCEEPPNCWALPVVTLASIALALPNIEYSSVKQLAYGLHEGLHYVNLIEDTLDTGNSKNIRIAAHLVWHGVDLYQKWLDVDLRKFSSQQQNWKSILKELADAATTRYTENKDIDMTVCLKEKPSKWSAKVLAANSMYRISETILLTKKEQTNEKLFEALVVMISDILGACFTNLQRVIAVKCLRSSFEERERSVRRAVDILGKTINILKMQEQREFPSLDPDQMACIDQWRLTLSNTTDQMQFAQTSSDDSAGAGLDNVYVTID
ncbi:hypothetical protein ACFE04_013380 [Oxalis oulophora]